MNVRPILMAVNKNVPTLMDPLSVTAMLGLLWIAMKELVLVRLELSNRHISTVISNCLKVISNTTQ